MWMEKFKWNLNENGKIQLKFEGEWKNSNEIWMRMEKFKWNLNANGNEIPLLCLYRKRKFYELAIKAPVSMHREFFYDPCSSSPNLDCNYSFPTDLTPNGIV